MLYQIYFSPTGGTKRVADIVAEHSIMHQFATGRPDVSDCQQTKGVWKKDRYCTKKGCTRGSCGTGKYTVPAVWQCTFEATCGKSVQRMRDMRCRCIV